MEIQASLNENQKILETLSLNKKSYKLEIISNNSELIIKIYSNDIEDCDLSYEMKFKLNELYNLNKYFRQFDTIDEVFKALENNAKMIKEKSNLKVYDINFESANLCLKINLFLMSGNTQSINILMDKIKLNEKEVIYKLKSYIKYIKSIPGVNELIMKFENKQDSKVIFTEKSKIIPNFEDFKFIYDEICKKLNKTKIKLIQRFNVLKDGDSAKTFHEKCDNIGPNISLVKTKENLIFGGFTVNNWSTQIKNKKDDLAFIFNYQTKKIHNNKKDKNAIHCTNSYLIDFRHSWESCSTLALYDNCLSSFCYTCSVRDTSYSNFLYDFELNNGKDIFYVSEFELYEIE